MTLAIAPTSFDLGPAGTSTTASLSTDLVSEDWTATGNPTGVTVSPSSGTGLATGSPVTITFTVNRGTAGATGSPVITFTGAANAPTFTLSWSSPPPPVFGGGLALQGELNRLAKTVGLGEDEAACIWAGIPVGMVAQGALNIKAGTVGVELQGVCNILAGTVGLGAPGALAKIATP